MSQESEGGTCHGRIEIRGIIGDESLEEEKPMDALVEELRKSQRGEIDPISRYDQAYVTFRKRCLELWDRGILPSDNERYMWSTEHDKIMENLLEQVWREFNLGNYAPTDSETG